ALFFLLLCSRAPPRSPLFPYTTLFRSEAGVDDVHLIAALALHRRMTEAELRHAVGDRVYDAFAPHGLLYNHDAEDTDNLAFLGRSEEHTSELQSRENLVCRLLLEKKKK